MKPFMPPLEGICGTCEQTLPIRKDGRLKRHPVPYDPDGPIRYGDCPGAGQPPAIRLRAAQGAAVTTDHIAGLKSELDRLRAVEKAALQFADDLDDYCSPHGVSAQYAQELRTRLKTAGQRANAYDTEERQ